MNKGGLKKAFYKAMDNLFYAPAKHIDARGYLPHLHKLHPINIFAQPDTKPLFLSYASAFYFTMESMNSGEPFSLAILLTIAGVCSAFLKSMTAVTSHYIEKEFTRHTGIEYPNYYFNTKPEKGDKNSIEGSAAINFEIQSGISLRSLLEKTIIFMTVVTLVSGSPLIAALILPSLYIDDFKGRYYAERVAMGDWTVHSGTPPKEEKKREVKKSPAITLAPAPIKS